MPLWTQGKALFFSFIYAFNSKSVTTQAALACDCVDTEEYKLKDTWEGENDVGDVLVTVQWLAKADDCDFQNNKKVLGNAAQMLYADPSRRFMFGMTIANTTTRLWYFSRARVVVSESFNFSLCADILSFADGY